MRRHAGLGRGEIAHQAHGADHRFRRALHLGKAGVLEEVGVEQHPQHGANLIVGPEVLVFQHLDGLRVPRRRVLPRRHLYVIGDEEVVQVPREESGGGRLLDDDVDDVLAIPVARLTQEGLLAVIMVSRVVDEAGGIDAIGVAGDGRLMVQPVKARAHALTSSSV